MTDARDEVTFDKPAKKATKKKGKARAAAPKREKPSAPFPGLTRTACPTACHATRCAISGIPHCAHPTKGGLPASLQNNPAALKRQQDARDQIDVRLDPDRFK